MVPTPSMVMTAMAMVVAIVAMGVLAMMEMRSSMVVPVGVAAAPAIPGCSQIGAAGKVASWPWVRAGHGGGGKKQGNGCENPTHGAISCGQPCQHGDRLCFPHGACKTAPRRALASTSPIEDHLASLT